MGVSHHSNNGLEVAELTDIGLRRNNNQDAHVVSVATSDTLWQTRGHLFMVADGMGAHAAGELASKMAIDAVPLTYHKLVDQPPPIALQRAVEDANRKIHDHGEANVDFHGMGTTASVLLLLPQGAVVAQVGDSRVYRLRGSRLDQLSYDHSLVWEMMSSAGDQAEELSSHIPKNIITRSLGPKASVQVDLEGPFPLAPGDTFLLCSDGLTGQVKDEELGAIISTLPPKEAARTLVDLANLRGGPDNITVIIVRVGENETSGSETSGSAETWGESAGFTSAGGRKDNRRTILQLAAQASAGLMGLAVSLVSQIPDGLRFAGSVVAAVCGIAVIATGVRLLSRGSAVHSTINENGSPGRLGRGPHRTYSSEPGKEFVGRLTQLVGKLREAGLEEQWKVNWRQFDDHDQQAQRAAEKHDYRESVRQYSHAITFMMNEIRPAETHPDGGQPGGSL